MRYITRDEIMYLHARVVDQSGGFSGIRNERALKTALDQPQQTTRRGDVHSTVIAKAAALGYAIIHQLPFAEGNKRVGHAAVEAFLLLHGKEIAAEIDDQEQIILLIATGALPPSQYATWLAEHTVPRQR